MGDRDGHGGRHRGERGVVDGGVGEGVGAGIVISGRSHLEDPDSGKSPTVRRNTAHYQRARLDIVWRCRRPVQQRRGCDPHCAASVTLCRRCC